MSFKTTLYGKYFLLDRIAVGGMAEVFKAKTYGVRGFERLLVIKRILPHLSKDEEFVEMFIDEAKISVELTHANICQVTDLGKIGDNYFIAMEYIDGKDLRAILKKCHVTKTPLTVPMALYVAIEILKGLDYAHNRKNSVAGTAMNLIHRDISPQNIMLSYHGEVKIVDFGIAKTESKLNRTQAGVLKGKFGYMSPEQASGLELDARTDLFSAGIILWEMLTGKRLFLGENDFETLEKIKECVVPPPTKYNPGVPPELEQVVLKALEREPDGRFESAQQMQSALARIFYTGYPDFSGRDLGDSLRSLFSEEIELEQEALRRAIDSLPPEELEAAISGAESAGDRLVDSGVGRRTSQSTSRRVSGPIAASGVRAETNLRPVHASRLLRAVLLVLVPALLILGVWKWMGRGPGEGSSSASKTAAGATQSIQISTNPPGAEATVDGEPKGKTPLAIALPVGRYHLLRFEKEGFEPREEQLFVEANKTAYGPYVLNEKAPETGVLTVTSMPAGASIVLNGRNTTFKTPAKVEDIPLKEKVSVRVELDGYVSKSKSVVMADPVEKLHFLLESNLTTVTLRVTPGNATVYWDGKEGGYERLNLVPGRTYALKVTSPGYEPLVRKITPKVSHEVVDIVLKPIVMKYGIISMGANPWAKVWIDGKEIGDTQIVNYKVTAGTHVIEFTNPHFPSIRRKVNVLEGRNQAILVDFQQPDAR
ncbi:MAG: serine/threonine-protein kinase [Pseudomonadota bacterium]